LNVEDSKAEKFAAFSDRATEYIVRAFELILLASAFGYAAVKSGSVAASIVATLLILLTGIHIGLRGVLYMAEWLHRRRLSGSRAWMAVALLSTFAGVITGAAVKALYDVIVNAA
jgi:hypothetical protein